MTLAAAIVLSVAATAGAAYWAWRSPGRFVRLATLLAVSVPLALLTLLLRNRPEARSGHTLQVVGQYAFLLDTIRIGATPSANVRIPAPSSGRGATGAISVHFQPHDSALVIHAGPGAPPVAVGATRKERGTHNHASP